jgi:O-antigen/teichoic acid export membrane protein
MNSEPTKTKFLKILGMQILMEFSLRMKSILIIPLLISGLGFADYGRYVLLLTLVTLINAVASFGIRDSLLRFNSDEKNSQIVDEIFRRSLYTTIVVYSTTSTAVLTSYFALSDTLEIGFFPYIFFFGLLVELIGIFNTHLRAIGKFKFYYFINFFDVVSNLVFILTTLQQNDVSLKLIFVAMIGSSILVLALGVALVRSSGTRFTPINFLSREMFLFIRPLALNGILMWVTNGADKLILSEMVSPETLGQYSLAYTLGFMSISVVATGVFMLAPRVLFNSNQKHWQTKEISFASKTMGLLTISTFASLTLLKFAEPIVEKYFPPLNWNEFLWIAYIVAISYLFLYLGDHLRYILLHARITRYELLILGISALSNLILNLVLIPNQGIRGAAWSTFLSILIQPVLIIVVLRMKNLQIQFLERIMIWSTVSIVCFSVVFWNTDSVVTILLFIICSLITFYRLTSSQKNIDFS